MVLPRKSSVKKPALKKPVQDTEETVYRKVAEPILVRKATLNLALDTIQLLKRYDSLMAIRRRKLATQQKLARTYREIRRLSSQIKLKELPGIKKPAAVKPVAVKPAVKTQPTRPIVKKIELSPLEKEMEEIKNKLAGL